MRHCEILLDSDDSLPGEMLLEGVGDEVLIFLVVFFLLCLTAWILFKLVTVRSAHVHPDSVDQVAAVRRGRRAAGGTRPSSPPGPEPQSLGPRAGGGPVQDTPCPVCLDPNVQYCVETNCGHRFCAHCILQYWRLDQWPSPARCPVCRRQVSLLLPVPRGNEDSIPDNVQREVQDYNRRMAGEWRPLHHYLYDVPVLLRHMWAELWSERGPRLFWRLYLGYLMVAVVLYILIPLDIFPEAVFGVLGLIDDVMFLILCVLYLAHAYRMLQIHR